MHPSFKQSFLTIFAPLLGAITVTMVFSLNTLTIDIFIDLIFIVLTISMIGGAFVYVTYILYNKYELSVLENIKTRFNGESIDIGTIEFKHKNLIVYCELRSNIRLNQNQFSFHIPRKLIFRKNRKKLVIKPSSVKGQECFKIKSWLYITRKRLNSLECLLDEIADLNE